MKISIKLGDNSFDAEGDFTFSEDLTNLFRTWVNAQQPGQDAVTLETITGTLRAQNDSLQRAVDANQLPSVNSEP